LQDRGGELDLVLADGSTFPGKGRIIIADRAVDLKTGTLSIVAEFPNPDALLRPGQFGRVRLAATVAENALLVPQKAVTEMQSAKVVYVVGPDKKVALRSVVLGQRVGQDYIVTEGVKSGERIIVEGLQKVRPGDTVNPTDQPLTSEKAPAKGNKLWRSSSFTGQSRDRYLLIIPSRVARHFHPAHCAVSADPPPTVEVEINYRAQMPKRWSNPSPPMSKPKSTAPRTCLHVFEIVE
jgi:hypothetical protein